MNQLGHSRQLPAPISGWVDPRFVGVRTAFVENFEQRGELGASLCLLVGGAVVVDLWGGWLDEAGQLPWQADTLVNVFSVGKGVSAIAVARLVSQGRLSFEEPVARVWPEFGAHGKAAITVRQLLSHQGGLPALRPVMPAGSVFDRGLMAQTLAEHEPWWEPGTAHGYHVNTFGILVGELVRRASGLSMGAYLRREVTGPLEADVFVGLRGDELNRVAEFVGLNPTPTLSSDDLDDGQRMELHAYFNPPEFSGSGVVNTEAWRTAELPSTNGHASARGIARLYDMVVRGGRSHAGVEVVDPAVLREAATEQVYGDDLVLHRSSRFGIGFQLTQVERPLGPNAGSFGHFGAAGSLGFCDPDVGLAFGYAINLAGPRWQNPRNRALIDACYDCLSSV